MNKTLLTLSLLLGLAAGAKADVTINATNFPDANFRSWVSSQSFGSDGKLTNAEIADVTTINVSNKSIADLKGIEYFTALTTLSCAGNQLTTIDLSKNTKLVAITCSGNMINGSGQGVNNFIKNLPTATTSNSGLFFYDSEASTGNWMSTVQVEATRAKGWLPQKKKSGTSFWSDYAGLEIEGTAINATNFPDEKFRSWVLSQYYGADAVLTAEEIAGVTEIDVREKSIASLQGIEYFTALTRLYCFTNQLTSLDVSKNTALTMLDCGYNQLTSLDLSNNTALTELLCLGNQLTSLDLSNNTALTSLYCYNNQIQGKGMATLVNSLPEVTNGTFVVYNNEGTEGNEITTAQVAAAKKKGWSVQTSSGNDYPGVEIDGIAIDATNFPDLEFRSWLLSQDYGADAVLTAEEIAGVTKINVESRGITSLQGIEHFTALTYLDCENNQLTTLNVSKNTALTRLYCGNNQLASLDVSKNTALRALLCYYNQLTSIDVSKNAALSSLRCNDNQLTSLDLSNNMALGYLRSYNNQIRGAGMATLIETLPTVTSGYFEVYNADGTDSNQITTAQVEAAKAKGWSVLTSSGSDYPGVETSIAIDETNFPDDNFRTFVSGDTIDQDRDGYLSTEEIAGVTEIDVREKNISNLMGIEYFTALTYLYCRKNQLTTLDVSKNTELTYLNCGENMLTSLDPSKNTKLKRLYCYENQLTTLDVSKNTELTILSCFRNQLTTLDVSGCMALTELWCYENRLTSLNVSGCTALTRLECYFNDYLTSLDVSGCTALTELGCHYNSQMTSLDASGCTALTILWCYYDDLTSLNVSGCTALTQLWCCYNDLTSLDVSGCTALTDLDCSYNDLTSLDASGCTALTELYCFRNQLTTLNVSGCTALTTLYCSDNQLTSLDVSDCTALSILECGGNQLTSLDVSKNTELTELGCNYNDLTSLDVSGCTALTILWCHKNQIRGESMTALVNSLPDRSITSAGSLDVYSDEESTGNQITTVQVAAAKAKNWMPKQLIGAWVDYEGVNIEGDANGDGEVNATDIETIRDYILGRNPQPFSLESADLNESGTVDIVDLTKLIQLLTE